MSRHAAFRRQPVDQPFEQQLRAKTIPAPTRGIIESENEAFMQPGGAIICDNWAPTMRGVKLRGGTVIYCDLHALDQLAWANSTAYVANDRRYDAAGMSFWDCVYAHTSEAAPTTFEQSRNLHVSPPYWAKVAPPNLTRLPVISAFEYVTGNVQQMFAAQLTKLFNVTAAMPVLVKSGQTSGNYSAAQLANAAANALGTNWLIAVNDAGNPPLRYNGSTWVTLDATGAVAWANSTPYAVGAVAVDSFDNSSWKVTVAHTSAASPTTFTQDRAGAATGKWTANVASDNAAFITGPVGSNVAVGKNLSYVWKYRNRLFFIETNSMNVWYLGLNSVGGGLTPIPLAGAATRGGKLLFGASWSLDAGDGISEKCVFATDQGEVLIFEGSNPADPASWRQQGRYYLSPPLGMNGHIQVGGDMLILTVDGIIPLSQAINKDSGQLELATVTRNIKPMWRLEVAAKRGSPWTIKKWDEYGAMFVTTPGGAPGARYCLLANNVTSAWARFLGWDATCFLRLRADMFFGTQDGLIMQAERGGYDQLLDRGALVQQVYVATLVGGWEMFSAPTNQVVWHQARANFASGNGEPFQPQLAAAIDYIVTLPTPPSPGDDPGRPDVWDQAIWCPTTPAYDPPPGGSSPPAGDKQAYGQWDQPADVLPPVRNTLWVSIGQTSFAHAPIVQVSIAQTVKPVVELLAISAVYEPAGVNV